MLGEVTAIDAKGRRVMVGDRAIPFDYLIVAAGATHSYFGHPEWEAFAPGLKTIEDATEIRRKLLYAFEAAEVESNPERRREWLTFVIVGGGPTGVELAGAIGEIANETLKEDFHHINPEESQILIVDASPHVLQTYPEDLAASAEKALIRLGVRTRCGLRVTHIDEAGVKVQGPRGEEHIAARTVLWAAGVQSSPLSKILAEQTGVALDRAGRIMVQPDLSIAGYPAIFIAGDMVHLENGGQMVPGVAPAAMQMGKYTARVIVDRIQGRPASKPFTYVNKGNLATIGRAAAVADFGSIHLTGFFAWFTWVFVHILYLVGFQNRVLVAVQWAFHYVTFNRGARLITGYEPTRRAGNTP